jgi:hypothetical protein
VLPLRDSAHLSENDKASSAASAGDAAPSNASILATLVAHARVRLEELLAARDQLESEAALVAKFIEEAAPLLDPAVGPHRRIPRRSSVVKVKLPKTPPRQPESGEAPSPEKSSKRYSKIVFPVFERVIRERGPQPIDTLYFELPEPFRHELETTRSQYSPIFRVRRLLRRSEQFMVGKDGTISLVHGDDALLGETVNITRLVRGSDGGVAGFEFRGLRGITVMTASNMRKALRGGAQFLLPPNKEGRRSRLTLFDNSFKGEYGGKHNRDFYEVEAVSIEDLPAELRVLL